MKNALWLLLAVACASEPNTPKPGAPFAATFDLRAVVPDTLPLEFGVFTLDSGRVSLRESSTYSDVLMYRTTETSKAWQDSIYGTYATTPGFITFTPAPLFYFPAYQAALSDARDTLVIVWNSRPFVYARRAAP